LDELLRGSDREAAILFLMTLDEVMSFNSKQFVELKHHLGSNQPGDVTSSTIIERILKASTAANFSIQYVQFLEQNLSIDCHI